MKIILTAIVVWFAASIYYGPGDSYSSGFIDGRNTALDVNPPSEELEVVCAGLWIGEQNKKYWRKHEQK